MLYSMELELEETNPKNGAEETLNKMKEAVLLKGNVWNIPLLENLPEEVQEKLIKNSEHITYQRGSYLFEEGQQVDSVMVILSGRVKLSRIDVLGRENIIMILSDQDTIWESMFLGDCEYHYSAVALTKVSIVKIHKNDFIKIAEDPEMSMRIIMMLSRKLHDANERNMLLATKDPTARLAGFLLYTVERSHDRDVALKLEDIAAVINLRAETVSRKFQMLEQSGAIKRLGHGQIRVLDRDVLRDVYQG
ncbi:MAG: Crp/Fnr family transcriptional regulator [Lachnospiraceae bacterium]|nr:Crp/Fnr family transcriptional regulator [Lachnospiraceae bacterium]